jgi:ketosteroid isomerase-like protein
MRCRSVACVATVLSILTTPWDVARAQAAAAGSAHPLDLSNPDVAAIVQLAKAFADVIDASDADRIAPFYSANAIYMPEGGPNHDTDTPHVVAGMWREIFSKTKVHLELHVDEVEVFGDIAYDRGTFRTTLTPQTGGPPTVITGREFEILKKEKGQWKSYRIMTNNAG